MVGEQSSPPSEGTSSQQRRIPKKKKFTHDAMADDANFNITTANETSTLTCDVEHETVGAVDDGMNLSKLPTKDATTTEVDGPSESGLDHLKRKSAAKTENTPEMIFDPPILRKGDLVRLSNEQRSGRIQGGLARITRVIFATIDDDTRAGDEIPTGYDIEYVLGGKLSNLARCDLAYTTATAEGLVDATDNSRGHLLRRRRPAAVEKEREVADSSMGKDNDKQKPRAGGNEMETPTKRKPGRPPKKKADEPAKESEDVVADELTSSLLSKKDKGRKSELTSGADKKQRASKTSNNDSNADENIRSKIAKLGWETRRAQEAAATNKTTKPSIKSGTSKGTSGTNVKRSNKRHSNTDTSESDVTSIAGHTEELSGSRRLDFYTKQRKEMEKSLQRLEKVDRFGFFLDETPPEFDENYDHDDCDNLPDGDDGSVPVANIRKNVQFPDQPPFNFLVVRKRLAAGRYNVDMVAAEVKRLREIEAMLHPSGTDEGQQVVEVDSDELKQSVCNPIAVDWDTFYADIVGMCDAALDRDPEGPSLGGGHLGWAAIKVKQMMEQMYFGYGNRRRLEVEENEARERYEKILLSCGNTEAAMQGKWRKEAFPERKYERLQTSSVICDGLSPKDRSYAMYELETKLPDSFVGLAYTYDDSGQLSEMWMKTVADETHKKSKQRKKKKDSKDDSDSVVNEDESTAQKAAMALAKDDGVVRAQVQTAMVNLLIQVQDRVMTDLGVMHSPEARSANWDDGDRGRDYRGGGAEVEQGTHTVLSLPEVAEQEVWGIDCYTRKNVMTLIESEFTPEIAVEFVEKWLLPAINACPIDLAHKMSTAAQILEGQDPIAAARTKTNLLDDTTSESSDVDGTSQKACQPCEIKTDARKIQESCVFLRDALKSKIKEHSPPWLKSAARLIRLASDSIDDDYFRIHPKGHGSVVIGEGGLKANSLVTYYRGEVYPAWRWCEKLDAIEHVQKKLNLRPNLPDFYNMAMERPKKDPRGYCLLFVDASRKSGLGSSFSHSCNPTCEVRVVSLNGKLSLSMTTLRDLEQGEELTFDYNAVTESLNEYRFAVCLCGQKKCRGSFLHYATADCYQQVLSRNSPVSARFANLVRGCMKQVMSKEDSELLLKHGFNTAAFGAVSFNHHSGVDPQSNPDSIENVPVWLRTYVADCLRYIEYERRALPVALLCNQMERMENKQPKLKASLPKKEKPAPANELSSSKMKSVAGSKPATSYFFFLQSQREHWESIARQNYGDLKGLEFSQEVNKEASRAWGNLTDEEKLSWKKKSIADWKKNGGKEKAKLEAERQRGLKNLSDGSAKSSEPAKATEKQIGNNEGGNGDNGKPAEHESLVETKSISIADADAEGFSAMEQRIQQLAQSLSRIGRVLDRHRESVCAERKDITTSIDSDRLRDLVPTPLKIMFDEEVVSWIWSDCKGVVNALFSMTTIHFPEHSLLRKLLSNTKDSYPVLSAFNQYRSIHPLDRKGKNSCTSTHARKLVREALLNFRMNIMDFLSLAEKSNADVRNEKRRDQARAREEKKRQGINVSEGPELSQGVTDSCSEIKSTHASSLQTTGDEDMKQEQGLPAGLDHNDLIPPTSKERISLENTAHDLDNQPSPATAVGKEVNSSPSAGEEVMSMRGGGDECASTIRQTNTFEPSIKNPIEDTNSMLSDAPTHADLSATDVPFTVVDDVKPSSKIFSVASHSCEADDCIDVGESSVNMNAVPSNERSESLVDEGTSQILDVAAATRLQDLINAASSNRGDEIEIISLALALTEEIPSEPTIMEVESKKPRKKIVPMSQDQVSYLKDWLFDPKHILNPYPTEEEKWIMIKDIGIERSRLDSWFTKNRQKVLNPEVKPVTMKWRKDDQVHWETFRKSRYMLEATADLLLMYANTKTFFLLDPFLHFDSTPIDVYARELGNEVPSRFALNSQHVSGDNPDAVVSRDEESTEVNREGLGVDESSEIIKTKESNLFCSPDEVIDKVTIDYTGDYVLSQLLQWFNGGIGQQKGLPDLYGCVMLPPITGCWEEIKCSEVKLPNHTRWNQCTTTEYDAVARPKLAEWIADRYQRGSPWDRELAKYFCPLSQGAPDPTLPMGSPVLDYLVTGIDENIQHVSSALRGHASTTEQGRSKMSASDRLQSTVDDGMPAQAVANWVQCENPKCLKWRKLPWHVDVDLLPEKFFCKDNIWNPKSQNCDAIEDEWDMGDAPIKFDTNDEKFEVGAWFDVQREGKVGYHEAQVVELDFESNVKRIKFHFWKLPSDRDEWIVVGSPRIAPHHSYTPRPLEGYSSRSKRNTGKSKELVNDLPVDAATELPQKRKTDHSNDVEPKCEGTADEPAGFALFAKPIVDYLNAWMVQHNDNPYPTPSEKVKITADTGLTKRQIGDWMARSRKKLKAKSSQPANDIEPAVTPSNDVTIVDSDHGNLLNVVNLLPVLRNQSAMPMQDIPGDSKDVIPDGNTNTVDKTYKSSDGVSYRSPVLTESGNLSQPTSLKELEVFMKTWLTGPEGNLFPTLAQKERIIQATGIDKKRLEGWFFRARKKIKKQESMNVIAKPETNLAAESSALGPENKLLNENRPAGPLTCVSRSDASTSEQASKKKSISRKDVESANNRTPVNAMSLSSLSSSTEPLKSQMNDPLTYACVSNHDVSKESSLQSKGLTQEAKNYLSRWLSEHSGNPYPTREEKDAMMTLLGISSERQLEGWFCRVRKQKKKNSNSTDQDPQSQVPNQASTEITHETTNSLRPPNNGAFGDIDAKSQQDESFHFGAPTLSSNFASLLSAAKSELSEEPWVNPPHVHAFSQETRNKSTSHRTDHSQHQIQMSTQYGAQHGFAANNGEEDYHRLDARVHLSSFQSLESSDLQDRSSHASLSVHPPCQQPQHDERIDYSSYHRVQQRASPTEYTQVQYPHSQYSRAEYSSFPESYPADYSSYQHSASYASNASYYSSQGETRASPADYMHESEKVRGTADPVDYPCYSHVGDHQQVQRYTYPRPHEDSLKYPGVEGNGLHQAHTSSYEQQRSEDQSMNK